MLLGTPVERTGHRCSEPGLCHLICIRSWSLTVGCFMGVIGCKQNSAIKRSQKFKFLVKVPNFWAIFGPCPSCPWLRFWLLAFASHRDWPAKQSLPTHNLVYSESGYVMLQPPCPKCLASRSSSITVPRDESVRLARCVSFSSKSWPPAVSCIACFQHTDLNDCNTLVKSYE